MFQKVGLAVAHRVLEVGCGTGAILGTVQAQEQTRLYGVDVSYSALAGFKNRVRTSFLTCADAGMLPYSAHSFDIVFSHFFLLWVADPQRAFREMKRVTVPGGHILALAEPDYGLRVDDPFGLSSLGKLQTELLRKQGADVTIGSRLADLFRKADIRILEAGQIQPKGLETFSQHDWETEWSVFESDVTGLAFFQDIRKMRSLKEQARTRPPSLFDVPTYFACGQV